jgi:hypothetical protein
MIDLEPVGRRYQFELELEIDNSLAIPVGELGATIIELIFSDNGQAQLFPGVTELGYGGRLKAGSIRAVGYAMRADRGTYCSARKNRDAEPAIRNADDEDVGEDLAEASQSLDTLTRELRMFMAKIEALREKIASPDEIDAKDRALAGKLLSASGAILKVQQQAIQPLL